MDEEEKRMIRENNEMLKELLDIARKHTDPNYIQADNDNDFLMNVIANIVAKKLEQKFKL